jgi:hypothetical protein
MKRCFNRCFKKCLNRTLYKLPKKVYVLELKDNKYYVGESNNVPRRIWVHMNAGSGWTKKYDVIRELTPLTKLQSSFSELLETLAMMDKYGIDNVRGSMFTNPYMLSLNDKVVAAQLFCELNNFCRKCGGNDHFITRCKSDTMKPWVNNFGGKLTFEVSNISQKDSKCLKCSESISTLPSNYNYCRKCFYSKYK